MFQFSCRFAFYQLFVFQTRHQKTQILTVYQANAASLTLFSKGDKSQSHGTVRQISRKAGIGIHRSSVSQIIHKVLRLKLLQEKARSTAD